MPRPKWGQLREFCRIQGYIETRTDHFHYLKVLPDRSTSGTMVSHGVDGIENMTRDQAQTLHNGYYAHDLREP